VSDPSRPPDSGAASASPAAAAARELWRRLRGTPLRITALGAGLLLALGLVLLAGAMEVSSTPDFCGSCHVMKPYYESWKTSTHKHVACVDCHIPPGVTAELRKKYEAVSMVARYFTGTYGTNPWTEIDDAACLRCHERRLIEGREVFGSVLFDHRPHLTELRRGKRLRCTSCHSQIVQGSHIAVTASTCILCHFKDVPQGQATARCTMCHEVPQKIVSRGGIEFDHADVARFDMQCSSCHASAAAGEGRVPKERCVTCHNDPQRLGALAEVDRLHQAHVTDHKVDCLNCHLEIQHAALPAVEAAGGECAACHGGGHSPQHELYAGIGGRGVDSRPSRMFLAGVRCDGCHFISGHDRGGGGVEKASGVSCMSCHGPSYLRIFDGWRRTLAERTRVVRASLGGLPPGAGSAGAAARRDARANLELVERANGVHNFDYALALLERAFELSNDERAARGLARRPLPWPRAAGSQDCLHCHAGVETQVGRFGGRDFSHHPHLVAAGLECAACHRPHAERGRGEIVRFDEAGCDSCHHRDIPKAPAIADCSGCHGDVSQKTVPSHRGEFAHALHLELLGGSCDACHTLAPGRAPAVRLEACADCHA